MGAIMQITWEKWKCLDWPCVLGKLSSMHIEKGVTKPHENSHWIMISVLLQNLGHE